jgi:hypothetical protein
VVIGIFGGGLIWILACGVRFDYLVQEVYGYDPGEPIWVLDLSFTLLATIPGVFISLLGIGVMASAPRTGKHMNWIFLGSMMLIITGITSAVIVSVSLTRLHYYQFIVSLVLFGVITITCGISAIYLLVIAPRLGTIKRTLMKRARIISVSIVSELVLSSVIIFIFQLDNWSAVRRASYVIQISGWLSVALLMSGWLFFRSHSTSNIMNSFE